jgi:hypothetical protein
MHEKYVFSCGQYIANVDSSSTPKPAPNAPSSMPPNAQAGRAVLSRRAWRFAVAPSQIAATPNKITTPSTSSAFFGSWAEGTASRLSAPIRNAAMARCRTCAEARGSAIRCLGADLVIAYYCPPSAGRLGHPYIVAAWALGW